MESSITRQSRNASSQASYGSFSFDRRSRRHRTHHLSKSGAQDFCRKSCDSCSSVKRKRSVTVVNSDDCYDELATCSTLIDNGSMDCSKSGAQDFCRKSCNTCSTERKKRSDDVTVVDSDDCYDELASCSALIGNGGMDCSKSGTQEFCKKSCKTC